MNSPQALAALVALTVVFLVLNFAVDDGGTIFLILAVATALLAVYVAGSRGDRGRDGS